MRADRLDRLQKLAEDFEAMERKIAADVAAHNREMQRLCAELLAVYIGEVEESPDLAE